MKSCYNCVHQCVCKYYDKIDSLEKGSRNQPGAFSGMYELTKSNVVRKAFANNCAEDCKHYSESSED